MRPDTHTEKVRVISGDHGRAPRLLSLFPLGILILILNLSVLGLIFIS